MSTKLNLHIKCQKQESKCTLCNDNENFPKKITLKLNVIKAPGSFEAQGKLGRKIRQTLMMIYFSSATRLLPNETVRCIHGLQAFHLLSFRLRPVG